MNFKLSGMNQSQAHLGNEDKDYPQLHSKSGASLGYINLNSKQHNKTVTGSFFLNLRNTVFRRHILRLKSKKKLKSHFH